MLVKTSELIGPALDWAVAKCEGIGVRWSAPHEQLLRDGYSYVVWCPSQDWAIAGPIIERELLQINPAFHNDTISVSPKWEKHGFRSIAGWHWVAYVLGPNNIDENYESLGDTPLIAAMRCFVMSKLGDTVEIPEELE